METSGGASILILNERIIIRMGVMIGRIKWRSVFINRNEFSMFGIRIFIQVAQNERNNEWIRYNFLFKT